MSGKLFVAVLITLALAACNDNGVYPTFLCKERELQSGECTKGEFVCHAPYVLKATNRLTARCFYEGAP